MLTSAIRKSSRHVAKLVPVQWHIGFPSIGSHSVDCAKQTDRRCAGRPATVDEAALRAVVGTSWPLPQNLLFVAAACSTETLRFATNRFAELGVPASGAVVADIINLLPRAAPGPRQAGPAAAAVHASD